MIDTQRKIMGENEGRGNWRNVTSKEKERTTIGYGELGEKKLHETEKV